MECKDASFERNILAEDTETNSFNLPQWEVVMHGDDESSSSGLCRISISSNFFLQFVTYETSALFKLATVAVGLVVECH